MLVIIGIIGILAAIAIGAFHVLIPRFRLQDAGNQLDTVIKRARLVAIQRQRTVEIRFEKDDGDRMPLASMARGEVYTLVASDGTKNVAKAPLYALASGVEVVAITFPGEVIRFDELGRSNATGAVTFGYDTSAGRSRILTVSIDSISGVTKIEEKEI